MVKRWFRLPLWKRVLWGLVLGIFFGLVKPGWVSSIMFIGEIFLRLIRMLVVPVVFVSIAAGVAGLGDVRRLGAIGGRIVALFAMTTAIAVAIGMILGLALQPGIGAPIAAVEANAQALGAPPPSLRMQAQDIVPVNVVQAMAEGNMLPVIFFALLLGVGALLAGNTGRPLVSLLQAALAALFQIVRLVMEVTPFGVFALTAVAVASGGVRLFANVGLLALCVLIGAVLQMLLVHMPLVVMGARMRFRTFLAGIFDALAVAFSTASSSATLPVALRVARDRLRLDPSVASTVLPIGAVVGKDGAAMYVGLLAIFSLQALGIAIDPHMLVILFMASSLAAFGTAPIPSAAPFMLVAVLSAVGVDASQSALVVGLILPFDRLFDMIRTVPSACANLAVTSVVSRNKGGRNIP